MATNFIRRRWEANKSESELTKDRDVVILLCKGGDVRARCFILASFSPFFKKALAVLTDPKPTIFLPTVSVFVMKVIMDFIYTGDVRLNKDLVTELEKANKRFCIAGIDDLLSKHVGCSLPPKKRQRLECGRSLPSEKSSSLFRPWDATVLAAPISVSPVLAAPRPVSPVLSAPRPVSPVLATPRPVSPVLATPRPVSPVLATPRPVSPVLATPRPVSPVLATPRPVSPVLAAPRPVLAAPRPFSHILAAPTPTYNMPWVHSNGESSLFNSKPFPMVSKNRSTTMPLPICTENSFLSETAPSLPSLMPWTMTNGISYSVTAPSLEDYISKNVKTSVFESHKNTMSPKANTNEIKGQIDSDAITNNRYLVPGKRRCDICQSDFYNFGAHRKFAHTKLKKAIECCGTKFDTRKALKTHKKSFCDFRRLHSK